MRKDELLSLGKMEVTKHMLDTVKRDKPIKHSWYGNTWNVYDFYWFYRAKVFQVKGIDILKVCLFTRKDISKGKKVARYEIYLSKEENKYTTYDTVTEKWKTAKIDYLNCGEIASHYAKGRYYIAGTEAVIVNYLDNGKKVPYEAIFCFQSQIKKENLKREHKRITDNIDSVMELVPELPKDFNKWVEEIAMIRSRYIYYLYSRNVKEGFCTHCGQVVSMEQPKNNTAGICSHCKSKITFKAIKKSGIVRDEGYASIYQITKEGFILRYFNILKIYRDYKNPELYINEKVRVVYDKDFNKPRTYEYAEFRNTNVIRWCIWEDKCYSYSNYNRNKQTYAYKSTLYGKNLKKVFSGTDFEYSCIDLFAKGLKGETFYPGEYLSKYSRHKYIEYLVKLKLYQITKGCLEGDANIINQYGRRIHEVLKVNKEQVKLLCEMNATMDELRVLQKANAAAVKLTKEQMRWIAENLGRSDLIGYMKHNTAHRFIRYLKENGFNSKNNKANDYYDYLNCLEKLGYDLNNEFILFPKYFKESHDRVIDEWQQVLDRIKTMGSDERNLEMEKIAEESVKKYAMQDKHFSIRIPWKCEEIKKEGNELHHCVGTYVDRVLRKETVILFIRKINDKESPYYTMELRNNQIIQVRGKCNCSMTPEVNAFVEKFKAKKLQVALEREAV